MSSRQWSLAVAPGTSGFGVLNAGTRAETASYPFAGGVTGTPREPGSQWEPRAGRGWERGRGRGRGLRLPLLALQPAGPGHTGPH